MTYSPEDLMGSMPFGATLGMKIESASKDEVVGTLEWAPERCTSGGILHGGALMALADSIGGVCAFLNLPGGSTTSTIESKTNFLRGVPGGTVTGIAKPLHVGRRTVVVQSEIRNDDQKLVALVIQTQAVLD